MFFFVSLVATTFHFIRLREKYSEETVEAQWHGTGSNIRLELLDVLPNICIFFVARIHVSHVDDTTT
jgi:hypothetical protein